MAEIKEEYKQGFGCYSETLLYLIPVAQSFVALAKTKGVELHENTLLGAFDIVIQHSLIRACIKGGALSKDDLEYIKIFADYGNLPEFYSYKKHTELTWEQFETYENGVITALLDEIEPEVIELKTRVERSLAVAVRQSGSAAPILRIANCIDGIFDNILKLHNRENEKFVKEDKIIAYDLLKEMLGQK